MVGPLVPTPVAMGPALQTGTRLLVKALLGPIILATRIAWFPVLVVGLVAPLAAATEVAPTALADAKATMATPTPTTVAIPVEVTIGRRRLPSSREGPMAPFLARQAA